MLDLMLNRYKLITKSQQELALREVRFRKCQTGCREIYY